MADETADDRDRHDRAATRRKVREGIVVSTKMDKTAVVAVIDRVRHPPLRQDGAAHQAPLRPRRGQRPQRRRPRPRAGDPPAVEAEALAPRRGPGAGEVQTDDPAGDHASGWPTTAAPRRCSCIKVLGRLAPPLRLDRRHLRRHRQGRHPRRGRQEGRRRQVRRRAHEEGEAPSRRQLHPLRRERRRPHQRRPAAAWHPHLRPGRP